MTRTVPAPSPAFGRRRRAVMLAAVPAALALVLAGCSGGGSGTVGEGEVVEDGAFVLGIGVDIGSLDPHLTATSAAQGAAKFAYDPLVHQDDDGELVAGLAETWSVDGTNVEFVLRDDVTCSDGSVLSATTVKGNLDFIGDPENASPLLGAFVPVGATVAADDAARTVTMTLASPSPFVLENLSNVGMVCDAGLADRSTLVSATNGSGPFVSSEVVSNDHYAYAVREDYTWGPDGATTAEKGTPATVELRVIPNETTATNLLLSGDINAVRIIGPDSDRLAGKEMITSEGMVGQGWFNQADGRIAADLDVRTALVQALDLDELANVITSGKGARATQLAVASPVACTGGDFTSAFPKAGVDEATATLKGAGWTKSGDVWQKDGNPLAVTFIHDSALGAGGAAAAELVTAAWTDLGVDVSTSTMPTDELSPVLFGGGDWDFVWEPLNVSTPDMLMGFVSGPGPAEGGTNFSSSANADYAALSAEAMQLVGADSCATWFEAENALTANLDVVSFAKNVLPMYANGATFSGTESIVPSSIRLVK